MNVINHHLITFVFLFIIGFASHAYADQIEAGKRKAEMCVSCHGPEGSSPYVIWPSLAGKPKAYLVIMLQLFRDGRRQNPWMSPMAVSLSDQDIENLAIYFSSLPSPEL